MVKSVVKVDLNRKSTPKKISFFTRFIVTLLLMVGVFVTAGAITYMGRYFFEPEPGNFEECVNMKRSRIQESYPATCISKGGQKFIQPLSPEEQKLLEGPSDEISKTETEGQFCGGIMGRACPDGYTCKYDGTYPDASGVCIKK